MTTARSPAGVRLTRRQLQVLRLIAAGMTYAEIAHALVITEATVRHHISKLLSVLGARNRGHAVHLAHGHGLLGSSGSVELQAERDQLLAAVMEAERDAATVLRIDVIRSVLKAPNMTETPPTGS